MIAGIVSYNPDIGRLQENIGELLRQCEEIIVVDNCSENIAEVEELFQEEKKITLIRNDRNYGIAGALNQLMRLAKRLGYEWIVTVDQDSVILPGLIEEYAGLRDVPGVGMMTCDIVERNAMELAVIEQKEKYCYVKKCITSGCCTNIDAVINAGGFDESYFIDYVDFDMCIRLISKGLRIIKVNYAGLLHSTGNLEPLRLFGRTVKAGDHIFYLYHESPIRIFYFFRNTVFFWRKYGWRGREYTNPLHIIWRAFLVLAFESPRREKAAMLIKGIRAGWKKELV